MSHEHARNDDLHGKSEANDTEAARHAKETARILARTAMESHFSQNPHQKADEEAGQSFIDSITASRIMSLKEQFGRLGRNSPIGTYARRVTNDITPQTCLELISEDLRDAETDENALLSPTSFSGKRVNEEINDLKHKKSIVEIAVSITNRPPQR